MNVKTFETNTPEQKNTVDTRSCDTYYTEVRDTFSDTTPPPHETIRIVQ